VTAPLEVNDAPLEDKNTPVEDDPTPIFHEILINPADGLEKNFEIFNPHSTEIRLHNYKMCIQNGRFGESKCYALKDYTINPGEYFMLCRDKDSVPNSKTCHQQKKGMRTRNRRQQIFTLQRTIGDRNDSVDGVIVPAAKNHRDEPFLRKSGRNLANCGEVCWSWYTNPQQTSTENADEIENDDEENEEGRTGTPTYLPTYLPTE